MLSLEWQHWQARRHGRLDDIGAVLVVLGEDRTEPFPELWHDCRQHQRAAPAAKEVKPLLSVTVSSAAEGCIKTKAITLIYHIKKNVMYLGSRSLDLNSACSTALSTKVGRREGREREVERKKEGCAGAPYRQF